MCERNTKRTTSCFLLDQQQCWSHSHWLPIRVWLSVTRTATVATNSFLASVGQAVLQATRTQELYALAAAETGDHGLGIVIQGLKALIFLALLPTLINKSLVLLVCANKVLFVIKTAVGYLCQTVALELVQ